MSKRSLLAATLIATTGVASGSIVDACCLTDWMYGRQPAYAGTAVPYTAGYTPVVGTYAPVIAAPATPYTAGYAPVISNPVGSYSLQRPAYGAVPLDNPSVYTGLPVTSGYRGLSTTSNPFYGTGNVYPDTYPGVAQSGIAPTPVTSFRPTTTESLNAPVYPSPPVYPTPIRSGLSRFFNSLLGNGYRTSYYTAPITYYRPATTLDPISGLAVTSQQACTSTLQQVQRSPYATFQSAPVTSTPIYPGNVCASPSPFAGSPSLSGGTISGDVRQAGDLQPIDQPSLGASNIPSTVNVPPATQNYPNFQSDAPRSSLSPLTGSPAAEADTAPVPQPRYEQQFRYEAPVTPPTLTPPPSSGTDAQDSWNPYYERSAAQRQRDAADLHSLTADAGNDSSWQHVRPIPAPETYRNPFDASQQAVSRPDTNPLPSTSQLSPQLTPPALLPVLPAPTQRHDYQLESVSDRSTDARVSVPVREASILNQSDRLATQSSRQPERTVEPLPAAPTESGWYSIAK